MNEFEKEMQVRGRRYYRIVQMRKMMPYIGIASLAAIIAIIII